MPTNAFGTSSNFYGLARFDYASGKSGIEQEVTIWPEADAYMDCANYMKANLQFLLRAATVTHGFGVTDGLGGWIRPPSLPTHEMIDILFCFSRNVLFAGLN